MIFYEDQIFREEIVQELKKFDLTVEEHIEILRLADETLHIEVLDVLLSNLSKEKHQEFLEKFHSAPHDKMLFEYFGVEIHEEIKARTKKVRRQIIGEIKRSGKK